MFYVYVLQSEKDASLYIGSTKDLKRRFTEHNEGKSRYTNQHKPYKLIFYIALLNNRDSKRFEEYLKSGYGRKFLKSTLKEYLSP